MGMQSLKSIFCQWPFQQPIYWRYLPYNNVSLRGYTSKFYGSKYGTWCLQSIAELAMDVATLPLRPLSHVTCPPVRCLFWACTPFKLHIISLCYIYIHIHAYLYTLLFLIMWNIIYICIHTHAYTCMVAPFQNWPWPAETGIEDSVQWPVEVYMSAWKKSVDGCVVALCSLICSSL